MSESLFSAGAIEVLSTLDLNEELSRLVECYEKSRKWEVASIEYGDPTKIDERQRARNNLLLLMQGLLYRSTGLLVAASAMIEQQNLHGLALITRGHIESSAQIGYFCDRLVSLENKTITFDAFHEKLALTMMGASHELFRDAPKPLNILTCIERSDRHFARLNGEKNEKMINDCYSWLSDYCHPNFLSNASTFRLDKAANTFDMLHGNDFEKRDRPLVGYLAISAGVFALFFEDMLARKAVI